MIAYGNPLRVSPQLQGYDNMKTNNLVGKVKLFPALEYRATTTRRGFANHRPTKLSPVQGYDNTRPNKGKKNGTPEVSPLMQGYDKPIIRCRRSRL